jgi:hypothetical protein
VPEPTESWFTSIPNRDAYSSIRGFFYQAILSVKAWVELGPSELLELESGEDVDWVSLLAKDAEHINRTLGQIKYRGKRLTIKSPEALMSVLRYWQHLKHNPNIHLRFRFISNAGSAFERGARHSSGLSGIDLWSSLSLPLTQNQLHERAIHLQSVLLGATKPAAADISAWNDFRHSLQAFSTQELVEFLNGFSWMLRGTNVEEALAHTKIAIEARPELREHGGAGDVCMQSLLLEVLQKLSTPGPKTLTCDGCSFALENSIARALTSAHVDMKAAYDKISRSADVFAQTVNGLQQLSELVLGRVRGQTIQASSTIEIAKPELILDVPPLPTPLAPRSTIVQQVINLFKEGNPVVLVGAMHSGKTTLARILSRKFQAVGWAGLKLNENIGSSVVVEAAIRRAAGLDSRSHSAYLTLSALPPNSIVIIDDLDCGFIQPSFLDRINLLFQSAKSANIPVLLTSKTPLPSSIYSGIKTLDIAGYEDDDIQTLLAEYSCPNRLNQEGVRSLIFAVTVGEPLLVNALIGFLSQRGWRFDDAAVDALLSKSYAVDLKREMQTRLMSFFDSATRELLYRLALLGSDFRENQAYEIAALKPEVTYASEKISGLTGVWLQRGLEGRFTVSPLISHTGETNLTAEVKKEVHNLAASWILKRKSLTQLDAIQAIAHLLGAGEYNHAAFVLVRALQAALDIDQLPAGAPLLMVWSDLPLPDGIDQSFQLVLRGVQVAVRTKAGMSSDYALNALRRLLASANDKTTFLGALVACSYVSIYSWKANPSLALEFAIQATTLERSIPQEILTQIGRRSSVSELLLLVGPQLKTGGAVLAWMKVIIQLNKAQQNALLRSDMAAYCICMTFDQLWLTEQRLPEGERRWSELLTCLEQCEKDALSNGLSLVAACAFRAQQSIKIVHRGQAANAIERATAFISANAEHSVERFLVCQGTGLWLTDIGEWDVAHEWLVKASRAGTKQLDSLRLSNELTLAESKYRKGDDAKLCFDRAVEIVDEGEALNDIHQITTLAENATWLWLTGNTHECFLTWESAASLLFAQTQRDRQWRHLFVLFGNHSSVFQASAANREMRNHCTPPRLGLFIRDVKDLSGLYSDGTQWVLPATICWFAEAVKEYDKAAVWALRAADIADQISEDPAGAFLLIAAIPSCLIEGDYEKAIEYARRSALSMTEPRKLKVSEEMRAANPEIAEIEKNQPVTPKLRAEAYAAVVGVLPALLDVIYLSIAAEQSAHAAAASLCETCKHVAQESENPRLWMVASEAVTAALTGSSDGSELLASAKDDAESEETLRLLLISFGSAFAGRLTPREVYVSQVRWAKWITKYYQGCKTLQNFVAKKLADFWSAWIQRDGFLFRNPLHTMRRFDEVRRDASVPQVLLIAADAVGVTLPQDLRQWLSESV